MSKDDLKVPEGLSDLGKKAADAILATTKAGSGGGCRAFYTPAEWEARGEKYGSGSELIVVHDGGDLAPSFNMDYCCYESVEEVQKALERLGLYAEQCTSWYSAIYKI